MRIKRIYILSHYVNHVHPVYPQMTQMTQKMILINFVCVILRNLWIINSAFSVSASGGLW